MCLAVCDLDPLDFGFDCRDAKPNPGLKFATGVYFFKGDDADTKRKAAFKQWQAWAKEHPTELKTELPKR